MWCIPNLNEEFKERMDNLLDLYAEEYDPKRPVVCLDEKSKQLLKDSRPALKVQPGKTTCRDYEYVRNGTQNIFVAVEPKGKKRYVQVTQRRKKEDYAHFVQALVEEEYPDAECVRIVQDNLNTHFEKSLIHAFGKRKARKLMKRIEFHYTPKHASWLNMAEIEIGILDKQCLKRRIPTVEKLKNEVAVWTGKRNEKQCGITWKFTRRKAKKIFPELYTTVL
jgi:hypothetical protein